VLAQIARDLKNTVTVGVDIPGEAISIEPEIDKPFFGAGIMGPPIGPQGDIKPQVTPRDNPHDFPDSERCDCGVVSRGLVDGKCADCRDKEKDLFLRYSKGWPVRSSAASKAGVLPVPKKAVKGRK
jgi:hypothetical protein